MATVAEWLKVDGERVGQALQEIRERLDGADSKLVLDLSSVRRIDTCALTEFETLAGIADQKAVKIELRGVNIDVYKVLKLSRLSGKFSFLT